MLVEGVCQTSPANVLRQNFLFSRRRGAAIGFQRFQYTDGFNVPLEFLLRTTFSQMVICDPVVLRDDLRNMDGFSNDTFIGQISSITLVQCQQLRKPFLTFCPHDGIDRIRIAHMHIEDTHAFHNKRLVIQIEDVASSVWGFGDDLLRFFCSNLRLRLFIRERPL